MIEGGEKNPKKSSQTEVPVYQSNLDMKRYVEDLTYRLQMDVFNLWMNYMHYLEKIDGLVEIFNDRELNLSSAQISAIKDNLLVEIADLRPRKYEKALHEKIKVEVLGDFSSAENYYKKMAVQEADALDEASEGMANQTTAVAEQDECTESLNLRKFTANPNYRIKARRMSYFQPIAELGRAKTISRLITIGKELGLTPAQVEHLISTTDEEYREKLNAEAEIIGLFSAPRKKVQVAGQKKETAAQREFEELKNKYLRGEFKTHTQFANAVNEMLDEKFGKPSAKKELPIQ